MPGLNLKTSLFPYRLKLKNREPIHLDLTITNNGSGITINKDEISDNVDFALVQIGVAGAGASSLDRRNGVGSLQDADGEDQVMIHPNEEIN